MAACISWRGSRGTAAPFATHMRDCWSSHTSHSLIWCACLEQLVGLAVAAAWSAGGQRLAVALAGGGVSLRERSGAEAAALCLPAPVASIAWRPAECAQHGAF